MARVSQTLTLTGLSEVKAKLGNLTPIVKSAIEAQASNLGYEMVGWARNNAPWTDQTGNARRSLTSSTKVGNGEVVVSIGHGVHYGIFLELCNSGRYAIIEKTIQQFAPKLTEIASMAISDL